MISACHCSRSELPIFSKFDFLQFLSAPSCRSKVVICFRMLFKSDLRILLLNSGDPQSSLARFLNSDLQRSPKFTRVPKVYQSRQERHGQLPDHRRHGPAALGLGRRILHRVLGQRLYRASQEETGAGAVHDGNREGKRPKSFQNAISQISCPCWTHEARVA